MDVDTLGSRLKEWSDLMARTQAVLAQSQVAAAAKATGDEFSIVDANSVMSAYLKIWSEVMSPGATPCRFSDRVTAV